MRCGIVGNVHRTSRGRGSHELHRKHDPVYFSRPVGGVHPQVAHWVRESPDLRTAAGHAAGQHPDHTGQSAAGSGHQRPDHLAKPEQFPLAGHPSPAAGHGGRGGPRDLAAALLPALDHQNGFGRRCGISGTGNGHSPAAPHPPGPSGDPVAAVSGGLLLRYVRGAVRHQYVSGSLPSAHCQGLR